VPLDFSVNQLSSQIWFQFLLVGMLGFLTGLQLREYFLSKERPFSLGTSRTFTFIALLGYVLARLDPDLRLYLLGMAALVVLNGLFYMQKLRIGQTGVLQILISFLVYGYGPVSLYLPLWFLILLFVSVVFVLSAKPLSHRLVRKLDQRELLVLAKFLLLSGVILPLLPNQPLTPALPASPFRIWVGVVVISGISYLGYILKRYFFQHQGYLITGILGGLYSSTATTLVLARRSRNHQEAAPRLVGAAVAATGMMYFRLLLLILFLNPRFLPATWLPLVLLGLASLLLSAFAMRAQARLPIENRDQRIANPLELGVAFLFAFLFVIMLVLTQFVISRLGQPGLNALAFVTGLTDIDPFVLSLINGHYLGIARPQLATAILIAAGSNNLLKGLYAAFLGERRTGRRILGYMVLLALATFLAAFALSLWGHP